MGQLVGFWFAIWGVFVDRLISLQGIVFVCRCNHAMTARTKHDVHVSCHLLCRRWMKDVYAPFLLSTKGKALVLLSFAGLLAAGIYGVAEVIMIWNRAGQGWVACLVDAKEVNRCLSK